MQENFQRDIMSIMERLDDQEPKNDEFSNSLHYGNSRFQKLEDQYESLVVLISSIQNQPQVVQSEVVQTQVVQPLVAQPQSETPPLINFDEEALDNLKKQMQEKFDALEAKIEQKTDLDNFNSELTQLKDAIISLESVKHVDPASHASHGEDILDLAERMNEFYSIQNQI
jgi:uncharacterized protein YdcH (DUF465 family)